MRNTDHINMKNRILLLLLILSLKLAAQPFSVRFSFEGVGTTAGSVEVSDSFFFVSGVMADTSISQGAKSYLAKFNKSGVLVDTIFIRAPNQRQFSCSYENSLIKTKDGGLITTGISIDLSDTIRVAVVKYNSQGEYSWHKLYDIHSNIYLNSTRIIQDNESNFYVVGDIRFPDFSPHFFLLKIDSNGSFLFDQIYTYGSFTERVRGLAQLTNSDLLISLGQLDSPTNEWQINYSSCLVLLDTLGTLKKIQCTLGSDTVAPFNVIQNVNGSYYSCGAFYEDRHVGNSYGYKCILLEWDTLFFQRVLVSEDTISGSSAYYDFENTQQGKFIICGTLDCDQSCDSPYVYGKIILANVDGSKDWERNYLGFYGVPSDWSLLYDVDIVPNEGFVACGEAQGPAFVGDVDQQAWLIFVDQQGCLQNGDCGFSDTPKPIKSEPTNRFVLSPNPGNGIVSVKCIGDLPNYYFIDVYDLAGKLMTKQIVTGKSTLLNLYSFPNAIYLYNINNGVTSIASGKIVINK